MPSPQISHFTNDFGTPGGQRWVVIERGRAQRKDTGASTCGTWGVKGIFAQERRLHSAGARVVSKWHPQRVMRPPTHLSCRIGKGFMGQTSGSKKTTQYALFALPVITGDSERGSCVPLRVVAGGSPYSTGAASSRVVTATTSLTKASGNRGISEP